MWKALRSGYGQAERSQAQRLKAAVAQHDIKVREPSATYCKQGLMWHAWIWCLACPAVLLAALLHTLMPAFAAIPH